MNRGEKVYKRLQVDPWAEERACTLKGRQQRRKTTTSGKEVFSGRNRDLSFFLYRELRDSIYFVPLPAA